MRTAFGHRNGIKFTGDPRGSPLSFPPLPCLPSLSHLILSGGLSTPCPFCFLRCDNYARYKNRNCYVSIDETCRRYLISYDSIREQCQTYRCYFISYNSKAMSNILFLFRFTRCNSSAMSKHIGNYLIQLQSTIVLLYSIIPCPILIHYMILNCPPPCR